MPFLVVPMAVPSLAFSASLSASSSRCQGRMQWQRASMNSLSVDTPFSCRPSISPSTALGLTTTPGPITLMQFG